jgi:hypothetical protein
MIQYGEDTSFYKIFDIGFYYYIPVLLWIFYTPLLLRLYQIKPLHRINWKRNLAFHLFLSLALAPLIRAFAIWIDFTIKNLVGMESTPAWEIVCDARFIVIGSSPRAFLSYWLVIGACLSWEFIHFRRRSAQDPIAIGKPANKKKNQLLVPLKTGKKLLDIYDIFWVEADRNYVNIHTADHCYKLRQSLSSVYDVLDEHQFLQIHRSKIINKTAVESLSHWRRGEYLIRLKNNKLLSSSRTYTDNVKAVMD